MDVNDSNNLHKKDCKPEIGRGCAFCEGCCPTEPEAELREGCFKLHETPWLEGYPENVPTDIFEVRFKNTRRAFYQNINGLPLKRGDIVAVEASPGHDIGIISLTGDLVAKQMRRTGFNPFNGEFKKIYRKAKPYDIERWQEAIALEQETMILARQIAADMGLNMKIGDVEYQGDKIKAIFYYIADERVDFRELIKVFAERFHIRIEMKQIGARQEAGRIGGLGACGRELCCASWISSFTSVTTGAARAQDISLNPQKLAGQCSKLKCCLMYEYDTYADARKEFPRLREPLQTLDGEYFPVKSDILAGTMTFSSSKDSLSNAVTLPIARVKEIIAMNRAGKKVDQLPEAGAEHERSDEPTFRSEEDSITRFDQARRGGKNRRNRNKNSNGEARAEHGQPQEGRRADDTAGREQSRRENGRGTDTNGTDRNGGKNGQENRSSRGNGGRGENRRQRNRNGNSNGENRPPLGNGNRENRLPRNNGDAPENRDLHNRAESDTSGLTRGAATGDNSENRSPRNGSASEDRRNNRNNRNRRRNNNAEGGNGGNATGTDNENGNNNSGKALSTDTNRSVRPNANGETNRPPRKSDDSALQERRTTPLSDGERSHSGKGAATDNRPERNNTVETRTPDTTKTE